ncbi:MAG: ATP-binding protein [Rubrivivax sp.]|nr:MAG: ATP-binding protein [Rubrivivax sp.]
MDIALYLARPGKSFNPNEPSVTLTPTDINWNDFSHNYHALLSIQLPNQSEPFVRRALVMPIDWTKIAPSGYSFASWLDTMIPAKEPAASISPLDEAGRPRFITLLQGANAYRDLAALVADQAERRQILAAFNELLSLTEIDLLDKETSSALMRSEGFSLGFMRRGSAYQALHRGGRYLLANPPELLEDAKQDFRFCCHLNGFQGGPHTFTGTFLKGDSSVIDDRIHCLIGKNGCGKTRLLRELVLELGRRTENIDTGTSFNSTPSSTREASTFEGPNFRRVLCFSFDGGSSFPANTRPEASFEYVFANLNDRNGDAQRASISTAALPTQPNNATRLLIDIFRSTDGLGPEEKSRLTLLTTALTQHIGASTMIPLTPSAKTLSGVLEDDGEYWISLQKIQSRGEKQQLTVLAAVDFEREVRFRSHDEWIELSSGHRVFFRFAVNFLSYIDEGTLVILDEPETHLHPNLVCDFMTLLYGVLTATKSIALIATHSAYVVREVPTHCTHVYTVEDDGPMENEVYLRTLGASVDNISQAVFGDATAKKFHLAIANQVVKEGLPLEKVIERYAQVLSPEMLSRIAMLMKLGGNISQD